MTDDQENRKIVSRRKPRSRKTVIRDDAPVNLTGENPREPNIPSQEEPPIEPLMSEGHLPVPEEEESTIPQNSTDNLPKTPDQPLASRPPSESTSAPDTQPAYESPDTASQMEAASSAGGEPEISLSKKEAKAQKKAQLAQEKKDKRATKRKSKKSEGTSIVAQSTYIPSESAVADTEKKQKGFSIFRFSRKNESIRRARDEIEQNQRILFGGVANKKRDQVSIQKMTRTISRKTQVFEPTSAAPKIPGYMKVALTLFRDYYTLRPINPKLEESLRKSKMPYSPVQYMSMITLITLIIICVGIIGVGIGYYFFGLFVVYIAPVVAVVAIAVFFIGTSVPASKISKRRKNIDTRLPMALAYIATMASADVPVESIMYELGKSPQYGEIAKEARAISASSRLFGNDIVTALREEAKYSPSLKFAEFLSGITSTVTSGGNLKDYFTLKAKQFQSELSTLIKQNSESVGVLAESYVTVGVAFPLMLIVILGVLASLSASSGGVVTVLYLIVLMMIPMITFVFAFLIQSTIKEVSI